MFLFGKQGRVERRIKITLHVSLYEATLFPYRKKKKDLVIRRRLDTIDDPVYIGSCPIHFLRNQLINAGELMHFCSVKNLTTFKTGGRVFGLVLPFFIRPFVGTFYILTGNDVENKGAHMDLFKLMQNFFCAPFYVFGSYFYFENAFMVVATKACFGSNFCQP